ncbi:carnitine dehydratase [Paramagnetospirillum marisnigri]|uniref:Carnitine dehydratase n=1 Tax=Paramagnetospirillum marisnigri TaxID=1285242 RepID=A0A178MUS7_9PROT|nr:CaiB/BaiF CoA-transferase family protein [Paramagnetospirillum marisnigri]OAN52759.1 carnitine dehydratase [Paramagnetospirillum marisnigri]
MSLPLSGLLVVALEQAVAAPLCTSRLADAGARVIKIERPEGDFARGYDHVAQGESAYFVWINRGKDSLTLDIKAPEDAALLERILARADVFVQNLAPGAAERAGFGSEALRQRHPRLITCDITGYGEDGPYRDMKAYDLLVQAEVGLAAITGAPEAPGRVGVSVADIACGMYAHAGILQALLERERSGKGSGIAVSLFDALADWMTVPLLHHDYGGKAPERVGLNHPSIAPYGAFALGDGRQVVLSIQNEREWAQFCEVVLEHPAMTHDPRFASNRVRVANRPELETIITAVFAALDHAEAVRRLNAARIAYGSLNGVAELSDHVQLRRMAQPTPSGPVQMVAPPVQIRGENFTPRPVPALGQQSDSIRKEFAS